MWIEKTRDTRHVYATLKQSSSSEEIYHDSVRLLNSATNSDLLIAAKNRQSSSVPILVKLNFRADFLGL